MKPLLHLDLVERAQLLHDLFPEEIPKLADYIDGMCESFIDDQEQHRTSWTNLVISFDRWLALAQEIRSAISRYGRNLYKKRSLFATELFGWTKGLVSAHCLMVYVTTQQLANLKFKAMIEILFDERPSA